MAEIRELRETPGALYLYSGDVQGTLIVHSAMLVTGVEEDDYIIIAAEQGQPRQLTIDGELEEKEGNFFFKSNGKNYVLSDFSETHADVLFGGLPLTKELAELYVTSGLKVSVGIKDNQPVGVYLTSSDGTIYSRENSSWVEKSEISEDETVVEVGKNNAAMVARGLDVGVDITLEEANIKNPK